LWIWKPCSQSCGRGIKVLGAEISDEDAKDMSRKRGIVQRYIPNPLLINDFKFDLRIYIVVISYEPLKVYMNDEGLVRLATEKYSTDPSSLACKTVHLTNYSVNKQSEKFVQNTDQKEQACNGEEGDENEIPEASDGAQASKWSFAELRRYFDAHDLDYNLCFDRIKDMTIKTLLASILRVMSAPMKRMFPSIRVLYRIFASCLSSSERSPRLVRGAKCRSKESWHSLSKMVLNVFFLPPKIAL
jgi:hypothetical protein